MLSRRCIGTVTLGFALVAGCATASKDNGAADAAIVIGGDGSVVVDAPLSIDSAPPVDAAPMMMTLKQTTNTTPVAADSVACANQSTGATKENSWYRVFPLSDFGITGPFHVTNVTFWVQSAAAGSGGMQAAQLKLGNYTGTVGNSTIDLSKVTALNAANIQIPDGNLTMVATPLKADLPAGGNLIVEIFSPDGEAANNSFYLGATNAGETHPGYLRAPACSSNSQVPKSTVALGFASANLLITVDGTY